MNSKNCISDKNTIVIYTFTYNLITYKVIYNLITKELLLTYNGITIKLSNYQCIDYDNPLNIPPITPPPTSFTGFNYRGDFSLTTTYMNGDLVRYQCGSYVCYVNNTINIIPTNTTKWYLLAKDGVIKYFQDCDADNPDVCTDCTYEYEIFRNNSQYTNELNQFYNTILNGKAQNLWLSLNTDYNFNTSLILNTLSPINFNVIENIENLLFSYYQPTNKITFIKKGIFRITYCIYYLLNGSGTDKFQISCYMNNTVYQQSKKTVKLNNGEENSIEHTFIIKTIGDNYFLNLYYDNTNISYNGTINILKNSYISIEYIGI